MLLEEAFLAEAVTVDLRGADHPLRAHLVERARVPDQLLREALALVLEVALAASAGLGAHAVGRALLLARARAARLRLGQALAVLLEEALHAEAESALRRVALGVTDALA